jgi:RNA polymerase sigma factor (sigma-70 family)
MCGTVQYWRCLACYNISVSDRVERFPTTRWSVVIAAQGETPDAREALEALFATYWYPVYAFMRSRSSHASDAEDLTQGFFAGLLIHSSLASVRPELGRFRAFLLASAKHYVLNERARENAQKRGGLQSHLSLDFDSAAVRYRLEASSDENPDVQFEKQWARTTFEVAEEKLRQQYAASGQAIHFEAFRSYLEVAAEPPPYAEVAAALEMNEAAVKTAVHRVRRRFGRVLREQIADTVAGAKETAAWQREVSDEVKYLLRILGR